jgi:hypothetical protein
MNRLVNLLIEQTESESVAWTSVGETAYETVNDAGSVVMWSNDRDSAPPFTIRIYDPAGDQVAELDTSDLEGSLKPSIHRLYAMVHKRLNDADPLLRQMIDALESPQQPSENAPIDVDDIPF